MSNWYDGLTQIEIELMQGAGGDGAALSTAQTALNKADEAYSYGTTALTKAEEAVSYGSAALTSVSDAKTAVYNTSEIVNMYQATKVSGWTTQAVDQTLLGSLGFELSNTVPKFNVVTVPFADRLTDTVKSRSDIKYAYVIIRGNSSNILEEVYKPFIGPGKYTFELKKDYSPSLSTVIVQTGVCTEDFLTIKYGLMGGGSDSPDVVARPYYLHHASEVSNVSVKSTLSRANNTFFCPNYELYHIPDTVKRVYRQPRVVNDNNELTNLPSNTTSAYTAATTPAAVGSLAFRLATKDLQFDVAQVDVVKTVDTAKYVFCVIRKSSSSDGVLETHIKAYRGADKYTFELNRTYNPLNEPVIIQFGLCDASFKTVRGGMNYGSTEDVNVIKPLYYLEYGGDTSKDINAGMSSASATWNPMNYSLFYLGENYKRLHVATADKRSLVTQVDKTSQMAVMLPPKIYLLANKELWVYDDSYIENSQVMKANRAVVKMGSRDTGNIVVTDTFQVGAGRGIIKGHKSHALTVQVLDYSETTLSNKSPKVVATKTVDIVSKAAPTGKTINTLMVGDSYIDSKWGDGIMKYISDFATADGNTMVFKGTRTSYGYLAEARSGWAESHFVTRYYPVAERVPVNGDTSTSGKMSSPFMFSPDDTAANAVLDFAQYLSTNNISGVDNVLFFLGMNGGDGSGINTMITNMKISIPNANFFICTVPPNENDSLQTGSTNVERMWSKENQFNQYLSKFQGRESEKIYLIPTNAIWNREKSLIYTALNKFQFADADPETQLLTTNHHPTTLGAKQLAYIMYNYLAYFTA